MFAKRKRIFLQKIQLLANPREVRRSPLSLHTASVFAVDTPMGSAGQ